MTESNKALSRMHNFCENYSDMRQPRPGLKQHENLLYSASYVMKYEIYNI